MPVGLADFPAEAQRCPRSFAALRFTNIVQYTEMPRGGHFPSLEEPDLMAHDLNAFVNAVLQKTPMLPVAVAALATGETAN